MQLNILHLLHITNTTPLHHATTTTTTTTALHHTTSSSCGWGDHWNHCNHSKKHNFNHLLVHQWIRSAIRDSQQPTSPIGVLFLKLPPPPCAVLLVIFYHIILYYTVHYCTILYRTIYVDKMGNAFGSFDLLDDLFGRILWIIIWTILHSWVASKSTGNQGSKGSGEFWCFENLRNPEKSSQVYLDFSEHWRESPRIQGSTNHHMGMGQTKPYPPSVHIKIAGIYGCSSH